MKLSWSWGVVFVFICFIFLIMTMVVKSLDVPVNLVTKDYYEEELKHEQKIEKVKNAQSLSVPLHVKYNLEKQSIVLGLPKELKSPKGKVHLFRPADARLDFEVPLAVADDLSQEIQASNMKSGLWVVKVDWEEKGKQYYTEKTLVIP